jgi:hypothetical protein
MVVKAARMGQIGNVCKILFFVFIGGITDGRKDLGDWRVERKIILK